jgi:branched-chain amino acid transport system substrate-binding protein
MMKRSHGRLALVVVIAVTLACIARSTTPSGAAGGPIVVGGLLGVTGAASQYALSMSRGIEIAVAQVNAAGGINGRPVAFKNEDTTNEKTQAVALYRKHAADKDVLAIIGPNASPETLAVLAISDQVGVPFVSPGASAIVDPKDDRPWSFRVNAPTPTIISMTVPALHALNMTKVALISASDDDFSVQGVRVFKEQAKAHGITIVKEETYLRNTVDLSAQLTSIKAVGSQVNAVVAISLVDALGRMVKRSSELGLKTQWFSPLMQDRSLWTVSGGAAQGLISALLFDPTIDTPVVQKFVKDYKAKFNQSPSQFEALGYDAALVAIDGLKRGGASPTRESVQKALLATSNLDALTGKLSFKAGSGAVVRQAIQLARMQNGDFVALPAK